MMMQVLRYLTRAPRTPVSPQQVVDQRARYLEPCAEGHYVGAVPSSAAPTDAMLAHLRSNGPRSVQLTVSPLDQPVAQDEQQMLTTPSDRSHCG